MRDAEGRQVAQTNIKFFVVIPIHTNSIMSRSNIARSERSETPQSQQVIPLLRTDQLKPNTYNPNRMTDEQFAEYVTEVRRLGRLPKPIVVRRSGEGYEIVDGEHGWRAANEVGFPEVPCEIIDANNFEAMLQTLKRNQHGTHNPLLEGLVYEQMLKARGISQRELAREVNVPETTIRNRLTYVAAFKECKDSAGEERAQGLAKLSLRQVELFLAMPQRVRDVWLAAGAPEACLKPYNKNCKFELSGRLLELVQCGLVDLLMADQWEFAGSLHRLMGFVKWGGDHNTIPDVVDYIRPAAELGMPADVMGYLPCQEARGVVRALLSPAQWTTVIEKCASHLNDWDEWNQIANVAVRDALRAAGIDRSTVCNVRVAEQLQVVMQGPEFIREADFLSLDEQYHLVQADADQDDPLFIEAKRMTCELLQQRRAGLVAEDGAKTETAKSQNVGVVYTRCLQEARRLHHISQDDEFFAGRGPLAEAIRAEISNSGAVCDEEIDGRPALDVLIDRLAGLPNPELHLLAAGLFREGVKSAVHRWLTAVLQEEELSCSS
jgi:ParB/RepB/Spo0J family partition protein